MRAAGSCQRAYFIVVFFRLSCLRELPGESGLSPHQKWEKAPGEIEGVLELLVLVLCLNNLPLESQVSVSRRRPLTGIVCFRGVLNLCSPGSSTRGALDKIRTLFVDLIESIDVKQKSRCDRFLRFSVADGGTL